MLATFTYLRDGGDSVILSDDNGRELSWPKDKMPVDVSVGAVVSFSVFAQKDLVKNNQNLAKEILNEILKVSE
ncbi:MAG: hypothetical protein WCK37_03070 [Candidatus Falkowbacteria bacterium]